MRNNTLLFVLLFLPLFLIGQEWSGGIRAGLNYSSIDGPSEVDAKGNDLEKNSGHLRRLLNVLELIVS
jgi:hypothetical protein